MNFDDIRIIGGSASQGLTKAICADLGMAPGRGQVQRHPDGNLVVRVGENVRGRDVYVIQATAFAANDHFMELLFWIDACKRGSAASVTAVVPYFSYAKGDKKDEPRVSIRARVCADAMEAAGVDRVVTIDLHAPQIQGFFRVPVDDLTALPVLGQVVRDMKLPDLVVVAPDAGFAKKARMWATYLGVDLAIADKERRDDHGDLVISGIIGDVRDRTALIVDDFTVMGSTLTCVARRLVEAGARQVYAAITHGLFTRACVEALQESPIKTLLVTDTVEHGLDDLGGKIRVVTVAPLFAEAIRRIHTRQSISVLFES
ncbi:MAG: ribose-phosphate pyrophosphokinase [Phycisphaeraceae bacterium]|nr:ribose-phosphate pyrophosphokinase [Phycisphaeraceae bacterium]